MTAPRIMLTIATVPDADEAIRTARQFAAALGFGTVPSYQIATAAAELVRNLLEHASGGTLEIAEMDPPAGLRLVASDNGPGIADIALAMNDGYSSKDSLGSGLPAVSRLMDQMGVENKVGKGVIVWACKWL